MIAKLYLIALLPYALAAAPSLAFPEDPTDCPSACSDHYWIDDTVDAAVTCLIRDAEEDDSQYEAGLCACANKDACVVETNCSVAVEMTAGFDTGCSATYSIREVGNTTNCADTTGALPATITIAEPVGACGGTSSGTVVVWASPCGQTGTAMGSLKLNVKCNLCADGNQFCN